MFLIWRSLVFLGCGQNNSSLNSFTHYSWQTFFNYTVPAVAAHRSRSSPDDLAALEDS